jgi:hypothetical protein
MPYPVPYFPGGGADLFSRYPPPAVSAGAVPGYPYPTIPRLQYDIGPESGRLLVAGTLPGVLEVLVPRNLVGRLSQGSVRNPCLLMLSFHASDHSR